MHTIGHNVSLIFSDLVISEVRVGSCPVTVSD
jgi:hypothetical protein